MNFNTEKVENMAGMFGFCFSLSNIPIDNFDTNNVKNKSGSF